MDSSQFRTAAHQLIDYIIDYLDNIRDRKVLPDVEPGYTRKLIPEEAPENGQKWSEIFPDIEKIIMPGVTHWHSPQFHAYYPTANSWPAILGDILSDAIGCIGFSWISSPACTDLEVVMMDWLGKLIQLPEEFLACSGGKGGGVIHGTASEATLVALLAARSRTIRLIKEKSAENIDEYQIATKLVAYTSDQAHSSVERAALLGGVKIRILPSDENLQLGAETLEKAIAEDKAKGLIPFYVVGTLGTTSTCAFDRIEEMGFVCQTEGLWMHVDAAYAGSAFVCEEFRGWMRGLQLAESFNFNPHKWLLVNFDCSAVWFKNANDVVDAFNVDPVYLKHDRQGQAPDYRHWQIPLGRRFRSLKLWFVMRTYGAEGLKSHIRKQVQLASYFQDLLRKDSRFEIPFEPVLGLVCFRLKGDNTLSERLLKSINDSREIHMVPSKVRGKYFVRFAVCSRYTERPDVELAWNQICQHADKVLIQNGV